MKKILVITTILVLISPFILFANPDPTSVKIKTTVNEIIEHKVSSTKVTNYETFEGAPVPESGIVVSITSTDVQELAAYYSMRTNTLKNVKVTATVPALKNTATDYYIPYRLFVGNDDDDFSSIGIHPGSAGSSPITPLNMLIIGAPGFQPVNLPDQFLYSGQLAIQFSQSYATAPAGDYEANIVFHIETQ